MSIEIKVRAARCGIDLTDEQAIAVEYIAGLYAAAGHPDFVDNLFHLLAHWNYEQIMQSKMHLKATTDRDWRALLTKAWYRILNSWPHRCHKWGYNCEWVYPYGWVPEGGCPVHD